MKITKTTKTNGLKIYTLLHDSKIIAQSTNINLIILKKESILKYKTK
jgi:hypothetical protein